MLINPSTLRLLWRLIDEMQTHDLLSLSDRSLIEQLLSRLRTRKILSTEEATLVQRYLRTKLSLIRDLANSGSILTS